MLPVFSEKKKTNLDMMKCWSGDEGSVIVKIFVFGNLFGLRGLLKSFFIWVKPDWKNVKVGITEGGWWVFKEGGFRPVLVIGIGDEMAVKVFLTSKWSWVQGFCNLFLFF